MSRKTHPQRQPSFHDTHLRGMLGAICVVAASLALSLAARAEQEPLPDDVPWPLDDSGAWLDERYASRPEAALPASAPYLGPPLGSVYPPSTVIFPEQDIPLRFFHDKHVEIGMACTACHAGAQTSTLASDRLLPKMEVCLGCHTLEDGVEAMPPADCSTCHTPYATTPALFPEDVEEVDADTFREVHNPPPAMVVPTPQIKFSHAQHTEQAGIDCATCHGDFSSVQLATRYNLPTMDLCLDCHTGRDDSPSDDCATCHLTTGGPGSGRLETRLPTGILIPTGRFRADDHRFDFLETHRNTAQADVPYCYSCHTEAECEDCHNGVLKPFSIHPPGYVQTHGIDAYMDQNDCASCHTTQDFCLGCHQQVGIMMGGPTGDSLTGRPAGLLTGQFHPPGWVRALGGEPDTGLQSEHGKAAQRNIVACASCHTENDCIACHSTQPVRSTVPVSPHPPDWLDRCGAAVNRNMTACLKCHVAGDPLLGLCR